MPQNYILEQLLIREDYIVGKILYLTMDGIRVYCTSFLKAVLKCMFVS